MFSFEELAAAVPAGAEAAVPAAPRPRPPPRESGDPRPTDWQSRSRLLLGDVAVDRLRRSTALVVGLGGVGGAAAEVLCRAGVGRLVLVDADVVDPTNKNRQLAALDSTVGRGKADVVAARLRDVNPAARLDARSAFLGPTAADADALLASCRDDDDDGDDDDDDDDDDGDDDDGDDGDGGDGGDAAPSSPPPPSFVVVECIDSVRPKVELLAACVRAGVPVVSSMGAGGRLDPTRFGPPIDPPRSNEDPKKRLFSGPLDGDGRRSASSGGDAQP